MKIPIKFYVIFMDLYVILCSFIFFYRVYKSGSNASITIKNQNQSNCKNALIRVRSVVRVHCGPPFQTNRTNTLGTTG